MLFLYFGLGKAETHYVPIFLGMAALYGVFFTAMCLKVREGEYPPPQPDIEPDVVVRPEQVPNRLVLPYAMQINRLSRIAAAVESYFRESFSNPYYLWFFASLALAEMAYQPINLFSIYFAKAVGMSIDVYGKFGALQLSISFLLAFPLGWLADKIHPLRLTMISLGLYAITSLLAFFFVRTPMTFAAAHVICGVCAGMWLTATAPLGPAILPKLRFMQYLSALHIVGSVGRIIIGTACGSFLDYMQHDYHYIYIWASVLITMSLFASIVVHQKFMALGGPKGYVAPE
jgi:hypothetical protein